MEDGRKNVKVKIALEDLLKQLGFSRKICIKECLEVEETQVV